MVHKIEKESKLGNPEFKDNNKNNYGIHKFETNRGDWLGEIEKELEDNEKKMAKYELELEREELEKERREMLRQQLEDLEWEKTELEAKLEEERERREAMMQPPEPTEPIIPKIKEEVGKVKEAGKKVGMALVKMPPVVEKFLEGEVKKKNGKKGVAG